MLNNVVLIGRLTKDCELRYTPAGVAVANFTIAVDRSFKNSEGEKEVDFIPIIVWRTQAENCAQYIGKGSLIAIEGRMQVRTYDDKEGQRRWITEVVANSVRFLDSKKSGESKGETIESRGQEVEFDEDSIPF